MSTLTPHVSVNPPDSWREDPAVVAGARKRAELQETLDHAERELAERRLEVAGAVQLPDEEVEARALLGQRLPPAQVERFERARAALADLERLVVRHRRALEIFDDEVAPTARSGAQRRQAMKLQQRARSLVPKAKAAARAYLEVTAELEQIDREVQADFFTFDRNVGPISLHLPEGPHPGGFDVPARREIALWLSQIERWGW